jgi:hypothetical protein
MLTRISLFLLLLVYGCGDNKTGFPKKEDLVQEYIESWNTRDYKGYLRTFPPKLQKYVRNTFPNNSHERSWLSVNQKKFLKNPKIIYTKNILSNSSKKYAAYEFKPTHFAEIEKPPKAGFSSKVKMVRINERWYQTAPAITTEQINYIKKKYSITKP